MLSNLFLIYKRDLQMCTFHIFARYKYRFLDEKIIIYYSRNTLNWKMTFSYYVYSHFISNEVLHDKKG